MPCATIWRDGGCHRVPAVPVGGGAGAARGLRPHSHQPAAGAGAGDSRGKKKVGPRRKTPEIPSWQPIFLSASPPPPRARVTRSAAKMGNGVAKEAKIMYDRVGAIMLKRPQDVKVLWTLFKLKNGKASPINFAASSLIEDADAAAELRKLEEQKYPFMRMAKVEETSIQNLKLGGSAAANIAKVVEGEASAKIAASRDVQLNIEGIHFFGPELGSVLKLLSGKKVNEGMIPKDADKVYIVVSVLTAKKYSVVVDKKASIDLDFKADAPLVTGTISVSGDVDASSKSHSKTEETRQLPFAVKLIRFDVESSTEDGKTVRRLQFAKADVDTAGAYVVGKEVDVEKIVAKQDVVFKTSIADLKGDNEFAAALGDKDALDDLRQKNEDAEPNEDWFLLDLQPGAEDVVEKQDAAAAPAPEAK